MGKTRFGVLDLKVQARELHRRLVGSRVTNVYDVNSRTYILKLNVPPIRARHTEVVPDSGGSDTSTNASTDQTSWSKVLLLIESGARIHTTNFDRDYGSVPSGFCLKLRKHIRTRRLDSVTQLGSDRMLMLSFSGAGESVCNVIVEFYAGGNIILTSPDYSVMAMLRTRRHIPADSSGEQNAGAVVVGSRFPIESARPTGLLTREMFDNALSSTIQNAKSLLSQGDTADSQTLGRAARKRRAQAGEARRALAIALELGPQLIEHALVRAGLHLSVRVLDLEGDGASPDRIYEGLKEVEGMVANKAAQGFLFFKTGSEDSKEKDTSDLPIDDVAPFMLAQFSEKPFKEFDVFDDAVDTYFFRLEEGREEAAKAKRAAVAYKKVDKLSAELRGRVTALESAQTVSQQKAQAIESNVSEVDAALTVVSSALAAGIDWDRLARMVEEEKKNGNPVAEIIHSLHLERNEITLMLEDSWGLDDEDNDHEDGGGISDETDGENEEEGVDGADAEESIFSDSEDDAQAGSAAQDRGKGRKGRKRGQMEPSAATRKALLVDVDLGLSSLANAREYHAMRKTAALKMEKAVEATDRTIKSASRKAANDAAKMEAAAAASSIRARRKPFWFEKFYWMVSSENYLIVAGRDPQQSELLVTRCMGPSDAYVHSDVPGSLSVVVKNRKLPGAAVHGEIPRITLEQAGSFAMSRSKAWEDKIVTSAWWVRATQVSKTAPSGLPVAVGNFAVRGKKHFLAPCQLVMGFAFIFKVGSSCIAKHRDERSVRGVDLDALTLAEPENNVGSSDEVDPVVRTGESVGTYVQDDAVDTGDVGSAVGELERTVPSVVEHGGGVLEPPTAGESDAQLFGRLDFSRGGEERGESALEGSEEKISPGEHTTGGPDEESERIDSSNGACSSEDRVAVGIAQSDPSDKPKRSTKRRMSAKERKLLKEGNKSGGSSVELVGSSVGSGDTVPPARKQNPSTGDGEERVDVPRPANMPLPRGKRNKLKKMKKKYGDQDEEEREIALAVLGAKKVKSASKAAEGGVSESADGGSSRSVDESASESTDAGGDRGKSSAAGRRSEHKKEAKVSTMKYLEEDGMAELAEMESGTQATLDALTGIPFADDDVEYALPLCAPYSALQGYRYRAKLLPGAMKRGKAYRSSLGLFLRQAEKDLRTHAKERDAMRLTPENDAIQAMLAAVRVSAPGLSEAQKGGKKGGRKGGGKK